MHAMTGADVESGAAVYYSIIEQKGWKASLLMSV